MKKIILLTSMLFSSACQHNIKNPITISNSDNISETKIVFTKYYESGSTYYGKAFVKNLTKNKVFFIKKFVLSKTDNSYNTYFLDKNTTFVPVALGNSCDPQKTCEMDIGVHIPNGVNFNELEVKIDAQIENAIDPKTLKEMK